MIWDIEDAMSSEKRSERCKLAQSQIWVWPHNKACFIAWMVWTSITGVAVFFMTLGGTVGILGNLFGWIDSEGKPTSGGVFLLFILGVILAMFALMIWMQINQGLFLWLGLSKRKTWD